VVADNESFADDISGLWGVPGESALEPPRPNGTAGNGRGANPLLANGSHAEVAVGDPGDNVARLADALAGHQVDVVRHAELGAVRAEMEDAFTQKLAVALYELLSASNERFSSVEDRMDQRLQDVVTTLNQSMVAHTDRLAAAMDTQQRLAADIARSARDELGEISDRFSAPLEALAAFERDVRHEVGRVGDLVAAHNTDADRRAEAGAALSEQLKSSEMRDAAATETLEKISERMASVQGDLTEMQEAIRTLREEVGSIRGRAGARRRWGRSG
jgi:chromosome segregation ATPase